MARRCSKCGDPSCRSNKETWCSDCKSEYNQAYRLRKVGENRSKFLAAKDRPCARCGRQYPPVAMDFDHLRDKRRGCDPASLLGKGVSWARLQKEIDKCRVLCANCHRVVTYVDKKRYRPTELAGLIDELKAAPCSSCGEIFPSPAMDFDHRDPSTKKFAIARYRAYSLNFKQSLLDEVAKCDLLCAVCHRLKTATTRNWNLNLRGEVNG